MTKLIRGKIIVESKGHEESDLEEVAFAPLDLSDPDEFEEDLEDEVYGETELLPEREGSTFATALAPWVGAERAWRTGIVPPPHRRAKDYPESASGERDHTPLELELSEAEMKTVLSSLPPASPQPSSSRLTMRLLSYASVAAVSVVITWLVTNYNAPVTSRPSAAPPKPSEQELVVLQSPPDGCGAGSTCDVDQAQPAEHSAEASPSAVGTPKEEAAAALADEAAEPEASPEDTTQKARHSLAIRDRTRAERRAASLETEEIDPPDALPSPQSAASDDAVTKAEPNREEALGQEVPESPESPAPAAKVSHGTSLSKDLVRQKMEGIAPVVRRCKNGVSGRVVVELVIDGRTGRVIDSRAIDQVEVGAIAGQCAAKAVELVKFPTFEKPTLTVKYPFDL